MNEVRVLGILIPDRIKEAPAVQNLLTKYGCSIKTRIGLHEASDTMCAVNGLILLELTGPQAEWAKLEKELNAINGVKVQKMSFEL